MSGIFTVIAVLKRLHDFLRMVVEPVVWDARVSEAIFCDESARLQIFLHLFHKVIISECRSFDVDETFFLKGLNDVGVQAFAMVLYFDMTVEYSSW